MYALTKTHFAAAFFLSLHLLLLNKLCLAELVLLSIVLFLLQAPDLSQLYVVLKPFVFVFVVDNVSQQLPVAGRFRFFKQIIISCIPEIWNYSHR